MKIEFAKRAARVLQRLDAPTRKRIRQGIIGIPRGDIKHLQGYSELYRLRIGDWRVVFSYSDENTVLVEKISPRGDVYKGGLF